MGLADELTRLEELRARGTLSEEEFQRAKARLLDVPPPLASEMPAVAAVNRLRRSRSDRWIGGVCGGVAVLTGVDSWIWRLIFALLLLFGGTGLLVYVLLWIFVPNE
jgi:phage shock protein PspC (stress-responsive transcriptional regulator)